MLSNAPPVQALESEEAAAARQARVSAALKEYRKTLGLDVDPAVEADAQVRCVHCACRAVRMPGHAREVREVGIGAVAARRAR